MSQSPVRQRRRRRQCAQCQLVRINGLLCHEIGCPAAYKDYVYTCPCGTDFRPKYSRQRWCHSCERSMR